MKTAVGIVLVGAIITYAAITLFGAQPPLIAGIVFFFVLTMISLILVYKNKVSREVGLVFIIFEILVICASFAFLLAGSRGFGLQNELINSQAEQARSDIQYLADMNTYYSDYLDYLNTEVASLRESNDGLMADILAEQAKIAEVVIPEPVVVAPEPVVQPEPVVIPEQVVYYYEDYDDEREVDDDD